MAKIQPTPIKIIIHTAVASAQLQHSNLEALRSAWQNAAGKEAAQHSAVHKINGNTLFISVDSPVWAHYLHSNKQTIEEKLKKTLPGKRGLILKLRAGEGLEEKNQ
jgi:predicted nucleic acid-binding Zn ribbon protein